jgi:hypothetical protein
MKFNRIENARTKSSGNSYPTPGQLLPFKIATEMSSVVVVLMTT